MIEYKPIDWNYQTYINKLKERLARQFTYYTDGIALTPEEWHKLHSNAIYGLSVSDIPDTNKKEKRMREFLTLHDINGVVLVRKSSIIHLYEDKDNDEVLTCVYTKGGRIIVKENIYDIINKLFIKQFLFAHINNRPTFIKYCDICTIAPFDDGCYITTKHMDFTVDESYREVLLKIQENDIL